MRDEQEAAANILEHAYQGNGGRPSTLLLETDADRIGVPLAVFDLPYDDLVVQLEHGDILLL